MIEIDSLKVTMLVHLARGQHVMGHSFTVVGTILILAVCSTGVWGVTRLPTAPFPASGATDITVAVLGWNAWQISYYASADVIEQLQAQGWNSPDHRQYGALSRTYTRASSFGAGELWEWAFVWHDPLEPQMAHIRVRRWIDFPRWRHLLGSMSASQ
jgi:hypothetical protein